MGDLARDGGEGRLGELKRLLKESERRLEETQALTRVGSWEWEMEARRAFWSPELLRMYDRDPYGPPPTFKELVGAVHPEDRAGIPPLRERVGTIPGPFHHAYRIVDAKGEVHYMEARGQTVTDESGKPVRAYGTTQDVSAAKRAEQDLRQRVEQQAAVASLGRYALSGAGLPALMEEAVQTVCAVLCVDLADVVELDQREKVMRMTAGAGWGPEAIGITVPVGCNGIARVLKEGVALTADYEKEGESESLDFLRQSGARSGIAAAIEGADQAYGVIGAHSFKARHFSLDDAHFLQAVGHVLGAAIERGRAEQIEAQLEQAQRLEAVGQLAGGVAHDFNNLLLVILSYTECLIADGADEATLAGLKEIERAAGSAAGLTKQLLLFSRNDRQERTGVDLVAAVRNIEGLLRRTIGEHIELSVDTPAALAAVNLAPGDLDQILVNLVVNARDALPQGGKVGVTLSALEPGSGAVASGLKPERPHVVLAVADDGEGMEEEVLSQVFDPFFSTKPRGHGTGLGLATVYGIVNQAGGLVDIASEPGQGTTVSVYLPIAESAEVASPKPEDPAAPAGAGRTILVVDNEEAVRTIVCHMLERHGYATHRAAGGAVAEEILAATNGDIDLLLTDVLMPTMSGRELVERAREGRPDLKVVYMSGYSGDAASPLGPWDDDAVLLEKPFTGAQLIRTVHETLG